MAAGTVVYAVLALAAVRRAGQHGHRASARLAVLFVSLGAIGAAFTTAEVVGVRDDLDIALSVIGYAGLLSYPAVLLWFVDALEDVPDASRMAVGGLGAGLGGVLLWRLVGADLPPPALASIDVLLAVFAGVWLLTHAVAARSLWRIGSRLGSALARRRALAMVVGIAGLGSVLVLLRALPGFEVQVAVLVGITSAICLWLGFAPPRAIRLVWSLPDVAALQQAESLLIETGDPEVVIRELLPAVGRLMDGSAAWITQASEVVAIWGDRPAAVENVHTILGEGAAWREVETVHVGGGRWLVAAPTGSGWLVVRTSEEPVMFGTPESSGLRSMAIRCNLLLRRVELELRERETARRLQEARHLEDLGRIKDDVLSTLSHELRTPLVTIRGASETLAARWDDLSEEQRRTFVTRIDANARDLDALVADTLHLASIRAQRAMLTHEVHTIGQLVTRALETCTSEQAARLEVDGMDHEVETDGEQLTGVLRQLISNAMKFSTGAVHVRGRRYDDQVTIEVADTGPGIPPDALRRVTEPMFRVGDVLQRETRGLGIGLTLAAAVAESLGGKLDLRSDPGSGTVATVTLPRKLARRRHDDPSDITL